MKASNNIADVSINCHVKRGSQLWPSSVYILRSEAQNSQSSNLNFKLACTVEIEMFQWCVLHPLGTERGIMYCAKNSCCQVRLL